MDCILTEHANSLRKDYRPGYEIRTVLPTVTQSSQPLFLFINLNLTRVDQNDSDYVKNTKSYVYFVHCKVIFSQTQHTGLSKIMSPQDRCQKNLLFLSQVLLLLIGTITPWVRNPITQIQSVHKPTSSRCHGHVKGIHTIASVLFLPSMCMQMKLHMTVSRV